MTIRVEREALLTVINTSRSSSISSLPTTTTSLSSMLCNPCRREEEEFVIVDSVPTKEFYSDLIPGSTGDDDLASLCTLSTSSCDSASAATTERKVTFATQLITDVWTRDRTLPEDISNLFYSAVETQTFRQEYRLEKKLLSELSIDPETFPVDDEELSNLVVATNCTNSRHRISRVCVVYNDKLETFCNPSDIGSSEPLTASFGSQQQAPNKSGNEIPSDFFDNDSFWSGSLTWY